MRLASSIAALLAALAMVALAAVARAGGGPSETIVLINDESADSVRVGEHYVAARGIPPTNVCRVRCTSELTVSRIDFVRDVVTPLRAHVEQVVSLDGTTTLRDRARFLVFTQGMPIRADGPGGSVSTAEMLALFDTSICGQDGARLPRVRNPYTSGPAPGKSADGGQFLLVTGLISSTADEAIVLIDRSVASDGTAPNEAHWIYQDASGNAGVRNPHYDTARKELEKDGHTTEHVKRGKDVVVDRKRVMGYMSGGSYSGLSPEGVAQNEYLPGAICDMLQSFGAVPRNFAPDGKGGSQFPVTHMVRAGVTGVHGTVAEPYSIAFPPADLFTPYSQGFTLAETFHQKIPFRYWMNLVIGDPLCAPYANRPAVPARVERDSVFVGDTEAESIHVFVDGIAIPAADPAGRTSFPFPEHAFPDGERQVLIEVRGGGAAQPRAWMTRTVRLKANGIAPRALPDRMVPGAELHIPLSRKPRRHVLALVHGADEIPHTVTMRDDGLHVAVDAEVLSPFSGQALKASLELDGRRHDWEVGVGPVGVAVDAARTVRAGSELAVRVTAADGDGKPIPGWDGIVELHSAQPPVRWARAQLEDGTATLRFVSPTAGAVALEARLSGTALTGPLDVTVEPGPAHHATTPLSRMPLGQAADVPIRFEDRFGNPVDSPAERVEVSFPDDPHARGAGKIDMRGSSGVLRDVILTKPGRQRVVIRAHRKTWSQPQEGVDVRPELVRAWLATRAFRGDDAEALFEGDPSAGLHVDGDVVEGRLFRRLRDRDATVDLPAAGSKDGDAAAAVAFVEALDDTQAVLRLAAAARVRVLLDGDEVFAGVAGQTDVRKAPADVTEIELAKGLHRLCVIVERKGRFGFRLALGKDKSPLVSTLRILPGTDDIPESVCVSGRVLNAGGKPVGGARVELIADGEEPVAAMTAADGSWFFTGVDDGDVRVRVTQAKGLESPVERLVEVLGEHVTDVDLRLP
jgi:uncharacterized protein (TIGR03790 family)